MKLLKLLADNRSASARHFSVSAKDGEAEIMLYDAIVDDELQAEFFGGVAPKSFIKALKAITENTIHLRINSPGGSVFAARAIETAIREHKAKVIVHIDGVAASAATFIAMAGDEVMMSQGAMFMIHKSWGIAIGNSDDMLETSDLLEKVDGTLAKTYADRTGKTEAECMELMAAETWMTADEALASGFIDSISNSAKAKSGWNLNSYNHAPEQAEPDPIPEPEPAPIFNIDHLLRNLAVAEINP